MPSVYPSGICCQYSLSTHYLHETINIMMWKIDGVGVASGITHLLLRLNVILDAARLFEQEPLLVMEKKTKHTSASDEHRWLCDLEKSIRGLFLIIAREVGIRWSIKQRLLSISCCIVTCNFWLFKTTKSVNNLLDNVSLFIAYPIYSAKIHQIIMDYFKERREKMASGLLGDRWL